MESKHSVEGLIGSLPEWMEMFFCVICQAMPLLCIEFYNCSQLHIICGNCFCLSEKLQCPICGVGTPIFKALPGVARFLRTFTSRVNYLYECSHFGCASQLTESDYLEHYAICPFLRFKCPGCQNLSLQQGDVINRNKPHHGHIDILETESLLFGWNIIIPISAIINVKTGRLVAKKDLPLPKLLLWTLGGTIHPHFKLFVVFERRPISLLNDDEDVIGINFYWANEHMAKSKHGIQLLAGQFFARCFDSNGLKRHTELVEIQTIKPTLGYYTRNFRNTLHIITIDSGSFLTSYFRNVCSLGYCETCKTTGEAHIHLDIHLAG